MKRPTVLLSALFLGAVLAVPAAAEESLATGAAGGVYAPGTTFNGVSLSGLQLAVGVGIDSDDASALGQLCAVLIGVSPLGLEQIIRIEGQATDGSRTAPNVAIFSGTASVEMGDGTPPMPGIPFIVTMTTDGNSQGTVGLVLGATTLPGAAINAGSMTIE